MSPEILRDLVNAARVSPSVHNVQPARWRIDGDTLLLLEDTTRRLAVGDPRGNDAGLSLGAAAEGLAIAASDAGYATRIERVAAERSSLSVVARLHFTPSGSPDPLVSVLARRSSWRGKFNPPAPSDRDAAAKLAGVDRTIITSADDMQSIARLCDKASYSFIRRRDFRSELRSWMRLHQSHARWSLDGLNADAMKLSRVEAIGAGLVLGPLFAPLAALGLAPALLAEAGSFGNATGIALLYRPIGEDPFDSGRHFHRLWLEIEAAGFGANVLAALADDNEAAATLCAGQDIAKDHRLVSAFRFGRRDGAEFAPARLPLTEILVD